MFINIAFHGGINTWYHFLPYNSVSIKVAPVKDHLEQRSSRKPNELFDINGEIVLFDLTNTYCEGQYKHSRMFRFSRSKERNDVRLVVLTLS